MVPDRIDRAQAALAERGIGALFVGPGPDLRYLIHYDAPAMERLTLLVVPASGDPVLVVPRLEHARALASGVGDVVAVEAWDEHHDPVELVAGLTDAHDRDTLAVDDHLWSVFTLRLQARIAAGRWVEGGQVTRGLRIVKTPAELAALRAAGQAIDAVHAEVGGLLRPGRSEREVGRDIADRIRRDHDEVSFIIVASGPNGASPHHETATRRLETGDAVVVDIGGSVDGYHSDCTRNYTVGPASPEYRDLHATLAEAQRRAVAAVRPGVAAQRIDRVARGALVDAGHGERFLHRTGHGIGVEVHEHPYIVEGDDTVLEPGMTFSVEPGIYVAGRHGARIEDIVAVTDQGVERLNTRDTALVEVT